MNFDKKENEAGIVGEIDFSKDELKILKDNGIAIFRGKIILEAQPPISEKQLQQVEQILSAPIPDQVLDLWNNSFGGSLDYDYDVNFNGHVYSASMKELFYIDSRHYNNILEWTKYECDEDSGKSSVLAFGGFEYLERAFLILEGKDKGKVLYWAQGLPPAWKGRLNENSITISAVSFTELFDQLYLASDPFEQDVDSYVSGLEIVEKIQEIAGRYPKLSKKLTEVVRTNIFNWQTNLPNTHSKNYSSIEYRAMRLALYEAIKEDDTQVLDIFRERGLPLNLTLKSESGLLAESLHAGAFKVVNTILENDLDVGDSPVIYLDAGIELEVCRLLINRNTKFDIEAVLQIAENGNLEGALLLMQNITPKTNSQEVKDQANERASKHEDSANKVEKKELYSNSTPEEYRQKAKMLRKFIGSIR